MTADLTPTAALAPADLGIGRLFEHVRDAVVVADATDGRIVLWNPTAETMFGYLATEALGMAVSALVPDHLKARHEAGLAGYRATGHGPIIDAGRVVELAARHKSGQEIRIELSLNPIDQPQLASRFVLAIIRDVTERAELRLEAERRLREVEALYQADEVLHRSLHVDDVLDGLVSLATEILGADKTAVMVWNASHDRLVPGASRGFSPESVEARSSTSEKGIVERVATTGLPIAVDDVATDARVLRRITDPEGIRSLMYVPIEVSGEIFGVFGVHYCQPHAYSGEERRVLEALAQRAALAIENARLYERAQQVAILEERQRLARELHDAVSQSLFAASLIAETLPGVWNKSREQGERSLRDLRRLTWGTLAEMRTLLLELRPAALTEAPLGDLVRQLADATAARADLVASVTATGRQRLPDEVQLATYRLAQEALNNVVKHAGAKHVQIELNVASEEVRLEIADDGRGFEVASIPAGHLGLGIMRERAADIGASLSVVSRPGEGTRVTLLWRATVAQVDSSCIMDRP